MNHQKTALLSAFNKDGIVPFATALRGLGYNILASDGTKRYLEEYGVTAVNVSDVVGKPILGHRVVTLSREIFAGLLAQDNAADRAELQQLGITWIDLVYVDLYPLRRAMEAAESDLSSVLTMTDIGGPALLRAAAKGRRIVASRADDFSLALGLARGDYDQQPELKEQKLSSLGYGAEMTVHHYCALAASAYAKFGKLGGLED